MYAIVDIAGQQFKVEKGQKLFVHRLQNDEGSVVEFDNVLLVDNDGKVEVGTPKVDGVRIAAKVDAHVKGDKVIVFKKKRRKGYQVLNGHRQYFTELTVEGILGKGEKSKAKAAAPKPKAEKKADDAPKAEKKAPAAKASSAKATEAKKETTAKKETAPKAEKKAPAKKAAPKAEKPASAKASADKKESAKKAPAKKAAPKKKDDKKEE